MLLRWLISLIVVAVLAVALALAGRYDPGYVVLVYPPWRAELSFVSFVLLLTVLIVGAYLLTRLAIATLNLPRTVREQKARREAERQNANFTEALAAFLEGRFQEAEKTAARFSGDARRVMLARVLAARAAHESRARGRRDAYLIEAKDSDKPLAALYAEAEAKLEERDFPGALSAIEAGKLIAPAHTALQRLELKARQQLGQWDEVLKTAEQLAKANALDAATLEHTRRAAHLGNIRRRANDAKASPNTGKSCRPPRRPRPRWRWKRPMPSPGRARPTPPSPSWKTRSSMPGTKPWPRATGRSSARTPWRRSSAPRNGWVSIRTTARS